ncbi:MAG TPA: 2OG-Fe(II) oxygenase family protein [Alphaproteobacteria bacterium]|nr:2OG-Fe(II) oxygenase family protein [Alphaproteobacteria bacterium]
MAVEHSSEDPFANKAIAELFPTLVWVFDLAPADAEKANAAILGWLDKVASPRPAPTNDLSLQTDYDVHETPAFRPLRPMLDRAVRDVFTFLRLSSDRYLVTGAWINVSAPGIRHHTHTHPNNYLSAVYYVATPKGGDTIRFYDPRPQAHVLQPPQTQMSKLSASSITIDVKPGRLVLFHSWLQHSVDANAGEGERISVAINLMFRQFGEQLAKPMWQPKLKTRKRA